MGVVERLSSWKTLRSAESAKARHGTPHSTSRSEENGTRHDEATAGVDDGSQDKGEEEVAQEMGDEEGDEEIEISGERKSNVGSPSPNREEDELQDDDETSSSTMRYTKEQKGKGRALEKVGSVEGPVSDISPVKTLAPSTDPLSMSSPEADLYTRPRPSLGPVPPINSISSGSLSSIQSVSAFSDTFRPSKSSKAALRVEIPFLPLKRLARYYHPPNLSPPTEGSRLILLPSIYRDMSASASSVTNSSSSIIDLTRRDRATRGRRRSARVVSARERSGSDEELGGYGTEDDGSDDSMSASGSESSGRPVRRLTRATLRGMKGPVRRPKRLTRGALRPTRASTVSEQSFYGKPSRMATRPVPPPRKIRRLDQEDCSASTSIADGSEGEEEVNSDEYDELEESSYDDDSEVKERKNKSQGSAAKTYSNALEAHRPFCEKCRREPADSLLERALALKRRPGKRRKQAEGEISDEELAQGMEGWLECEGCVVSSHWGCLSATQKKDVLAALLEEEGPFVKRKSVAIDETAPFRCSRCAADPTCYVCHEERVKPVSTAKVQEENGKPDLTAMVHQENTKPDPTALVVDGDDKLENGKLDTAGAQEKGSANADAADVPKDLDRDKDHDQDQVEDLPIKFRCQRCRLAFHYEHMKDPFNDDKHHSLKEKADWYQNSYVRSEAAWTCHLCREWIWTVDLILAWRPLPANAKEEPLEANEKPSWKDALPREYLVKWTARGFRHVTWVPHSWLQILSAAKLRHFLEKGPSLDLVTDETLAARGDDMAEPTIARVTEEDDLVKGRRGHGHTSIADEWEGHGPAPDVNAKSSIPVEWTASHDFSPSIALLHRCSASPMLFFTDALLHRCSSSPMLFFIRAPPHPWDSADWEIQTVDRVLDIMLLPPKPTTKITTKRGQQVLSDSASESTDKPDVSDVSRSDLPDGLEPPPEKRMDIDSWEEATGRVLTEDNLDEVAPKVTWCFVKWNDLQYDQSCWDTPPPRDSLLYPAFKDALSRFLRARHVHIPILSAAQAKTRDKDAERAYQPPEEQPDCVVGGRLMPFQLEGLQWLLYKHFKRESCILADDMGLGKTIQIASLLGFLGSAERRIYPCLVVVPNSTITNWVREFEKWVPHVRVVPYYGEAASRKIISKFELYHKGMQGKAAGLKAHIVLTTYDMITGSEFRVFSGIPRWELLCIDEGQRLKSDDSLIFNRLKTLNTVHRILLTGTPLNNNIRELFNLLSFLDPENFHDLEELQTRFNQDDLNEGKLQELHEMIKPYILRRIKADVLKLPPKVEIIVPISLAPLQKQVYKSILERNADVLKAIADAKRKQIAKGPR